MSSRDIQKKRSGIGPPGAVSPSKAGEISAFLKQARSLEPAAGAGRIILALDATMSRQPTWDLASSIQADMFKTAGAIGNLRMQLAYFRGFGEASASRWASDGVELAHMMSRIDCRAGQTQIGKMLSHALKEHDKARVQAVAYIGDAVEEDADRLGHLAGEMGLRKLPVFVFQEGHDAHAQTVMKELARLSGGGWFRFDPSAAETLRSLLSSLAVYASGGLKALETRGRREDRLLIEQVKRNGRGDRP